MSQENLELAKSLNAMVLAGDIDGALALIADDLVLTQIHGPLDEPSAFHGREAGLGHWAATVEVFDDLHMEVNEWLDVRDW
jgi:ketosteroid isomerase-like protein